MGNEVKVLQTKLFVATNMSLKDVQEKGNKCQKEVAQIFDFNGDGKFDEKEAATFNSVRITALGNGKYTIWQKNNGKDEATHIEGDLSKIKFAPNREYNSKMSFKESREWLKNYMKENKVSRKKARMAYEETFKEKLPKNYINKKIAGVNQSLKDLNNAFYKMMFGNKIKED